MTTDRAMLLGNDDLFLEMGYVGMSRGRAANYLYVVDTPDLSDEERGSLYASEQPFEEVVRALGQSRAKHLAVDSLRARRPALSELFAERDRLRRRLAQAGPDPAADIEALRVRRDQLALEVRAAKERQAQAEVGIGRWQRIRGRPDPQCVFAERDLAVRQSNLRSVDEQLRAAEKHATSRTQFLEDRASDRQLLDQIERSIEAGIARRLGEIGRRPPPYLTKILGDIPDSSRKRAAWWSAARDVETYRARADVTAETSALGPRPKGADLAIDWKEVQAELVRMRGDVIPAEARHGPDHALTPEVEIGPSIDLGLGL